MSPILIIPALAAIALFMGAIRMRRHDRKRASLMFAAAAIMLVNVLLWMSIPPAPVP